MGNVEILLAIRHLGAPLTPPLFEKATSNLELVFLFDVLIRTEYKVKRRSARETAVLFRGRAVPGAIF